MRTINKGRVPANELFFIVNGFFEGSKKQSHIIRRISLGTDGYPAIILQALIGYSLNTLMRKSGQEIILWKYNV
jgi:hypothetical protein